MTALQTKNIARKQHKQPEWHLIKLKRVEAGAEIFLFFMTAA
jgi:hypothetical protein